MRGMSSFRSVFVVSGVVVVAAAGACFQLDRALEAASGDVAGRGVRVDLGEGAAFVKVQSVGSALRRAGNDDGLFRLQGLPPGRFDLRLADDKNGDGWADRGATLSGVMPALPDGKPGFLLLGDIDLNGSFGLRGKAGVDNGGTFGPVAGGTVARVYALRGACGAVDGDVVVRDAPCTGVDVSGRVELGNDGETAADINADYQLTRLPAGTVDVVAVLYAQNADGSIGAVVDVEGPVSVVGVANGDDSAPVDGPAFTFDGVPPPTATVQLVFSTAVVEGAFAVFAPAGTSIGGCDVAHDAAAPALVVDLAAEATSATVSSLPAGPYSVVVCSGDLRGELNSGVLALPSETPALWPVQLLAVDPCPEGVDDRDCDGDGHRSIPAADRDGCVAACFPDLDDPFASLGENGGDLLCGDLDCDDDADGQPDVTEPPACIGIGRGTDLDGDGLCSNVDPFPQCRANTAAACLAGDEDVTPVVFGAEGEGEGDEGDFGVVTDGPTLPGRLAGSGVRVTSGNDRYFVVLGIVDGPDEIAAIGLDGDGAEEAIGLGTFAAQGLPDGNRIRFGTSDVTSAYIGGGTRSESADVTLVFSDIKSVDLVDDGALSLRLGDLSKGPINLATPRFDTNVHDFGSALVFIGGRTVVDGTVELVGDVEVVGVSSGVVNSAPLAVPRAEATAESVGDADGTYLVVIGGVGAGDVPLASVEAFEVDFENNTLVPVDTSLPGLIPPDLNAPHAGHTMHTQHRADGRQRLVVVGGGSTWETFTDGDDRWVSHPMSVPRSRHASTVLPDGRILVVGGVDLDGVPTNTTEVLDPDLGTTVRASNLLTARNGPVAAEVADGRVVIAGGFDVEGQPLATTEIFDVRRQVAPIDLVDPGFVG